jgi:HAD superfamily hydrolase (TIGR01549 family)
VKEPPGALIFDFDGTLYDPKKFALRLIAAGPWDLFRIGAERRVRKNFAGRDYGSAEAYYGEYFTALSRTARRSPDFMRRWYFEKYLPRMIRVLNAHYRPRRGTAELFASLRGNNPAGKKIPFAVYSDYPQTLQRLKALGLEAAPGEYYGPEDFGAQKPAARPFLSIAAALGCEKSRVLVAGDRDETDGAGAADAGMGFVKISGDDDWEQFCSGLLSQLGSIHGGKLKTDS